MKGKIIGCEKRLLTTNLQYIINHIQNSKTNHFSINHC